MIEAENLCVIRSKKEILKNLNFVAQSGKITVIAGPNGSGKTTLLSAIAEDLTYSGQITLNGINLQSMKPWHKAFLRGILPQAIKVSFPFLVSEVIQLGIKAGNGFSTQAANREILLDVLDQVDLTGYANRFYQELSGGEQARVQIARVLAQIWHPVYKDQPCWLLLDEPVAALDIDHQLTIMEVARRFAENGGGVVLIIHDLNLAARFADDIYLMKKGEICFHGATREIMTSANLSLIYNCSIEVNHLSETGLPYILPQTIKHLSCNIEAM